MIENVRIPFADMVSAVRKLPHILTLVKFVICSEKLSSRKHRNASTAILLYGPTLYLFATLSNIIHQPSKLRKHPRQPRNRYNQRSNIKATSLPASPVTLDRSWPWSRMMLLVVFLVPLEERRPVLSGPSEVVVAEIRPLGSSPAASCWVVTMVLLSRVLGEKNSRVSVAIEVAAVGRGVLGAAMTVGVERVAWLGFSEAIVGVLAGIGVFMVAWSVPSVAIVGVLAGIGVPKVARSVPSDAIVGVLARTGVLKVA